MLGLPFFLALKAEALFAVNRPSEALKAIEEAEAVAQKCGARCWSAELHRLRAVFLAALCADEAQIEASFRAAIYTAREQKSVSLEKRAEGIYAEYRRQKTSASGGVDSGYRFGNFLQRLAFRSTDNANLSRRVRLGCGRCFR
jgi:hypothetical protein